MSRLLRVPINTAGRDFIVGDIHGCFTALQQRLNAIGFNPSEGDRLFSVGDLVDRGPESELAVEWMDRPWFFAVAGNHEDYAIRWPNGNMDARNYIANGGAWNAFAGVDASRKYSDAFAALPVAIELETAGGIVGIVHADCPLASWKDFASALETGWVRSADGELHNSKHAQDSVIDMAQWNRASITAHGQGIEIPPIADVHAVVVGHTPLDAPVWVSNVLHIDTGACYEWGRFTIIDAETLEPVWEGA